jgi:nucleotide-binding universal stress UspA family protein
MDEKGTGLKTLIAVDGSEHSRKAVILTSRFSKKTGVEITLLNVLEDVIRYKEVPDTWVYHQREKQALKTLEELKKIAEENGAKSVQTKIAVGPVAEEVVRIAEEEGFSYIVVGTRGMSGFKRMLMGSIAEKVVLYSPCPVVIVR